MWVKNQFLPWEKSLFALCLAKIFFWAPTKNSKRLISLVSKRVFTGHQYYEPRIPPSHEVMTSFCQWSWECVDKRE